MRGSGHIIEHDHWMTQPGDRDYLAPADRWCRVCAKPDREHVCSTCGRCADDPYQNGGRDELCCDPIHQPFYTASQRIRYARFAAADKPFCGCDSPAFCRCDSSRYQTARGL